MVAKCGTQRVWHWARHGNRSCEPWWEPETPWHRGWKDQFPSEQQEIIRHDQKGEKHIADVMTENGLVIEFQHSHLPLQEKGAREGFYRKHGLGRGRGPEFKRFSLALRYQKVPALCTILVGATTYFHWAMRSFPSSERTAAKKLLQRAWSISLRGARIRWTGTPLSLISSIRIRPTPCLRHSSLTRWA
ncbi:competence protein CoiA family protein [Mesorhizobium sp. M1312]|uniref:hypothetical protein n=1 Tax=unclassified Mesorhizobium TaxID=325217 RepID=UPI00333B1774